MTISTLNSWLPGDERGWRSRRHRRHSSGDYRSPPPAGEHIGLRHYAARISGNPIMLSSEIRAVAGDALLEYFAGENHRTLAVAVSGMHAHLLVELPDNIAAVRKIIGNAKNLASRRVRTCLPGRIWATGGDYKRIETRTHHLRVYQYIRDHIDEGAWVWTAREGVIARAV